MWWSSRLREVKQFSCDVFFFNTQSWRTLPSFGHYCVPMLMNLLKILCFSCQGKSGDIVYQRICLFLLLIFAQHGLFENQLTFYSALSRLTDLGIYDITRCGIWLLTIFHIPYIHFQRELRKVTSPKWYLSFLFSIYSFISLSMFICFKFSFRLAHFSWLFMPFKKNYTLFCSILISIRTDICFRCWVFLDNATRYKKH